MTEPTLALQIAIRNRLIASAAVTALVTADHIIEGPSRPEHFPTIIIGGSSIVKVGHAGRVRTALVEIDIHVWSLAGGMSAVKPIGWAVWNAIEGELAVPGFTAPDGLHVERSIYMRDPQDHGHGVLTVRAHLEETMAVPAYA